MYSDRIDCLIESIELNLLDDRVFLLEVYELLITDPEKAGREIVDYIRFYFPDYAQDMLFEQGYKCASCEYNREIIDPYAVGDSSAMRECNADQGACPYVWDDNGTQPVGWKDENTQP